MSYDLFFTSDDDRRRVQARGHLPEPIKQALDEHLRQLAEDPFAVGIVPPVPYNPVGLMSFCKKMHEKRLYITQFRFHVDEESKRVVVRRVIMDPQFEPPSDG